jgi:hypothetical protein
MMIDPVRELKVRAELFHHAAAKGESTVLARLRALPELRKASAEELTLFAPKIRRKHCLAVVAREAGFESWLHAASVLEGRPADDFGTLLYPPGCAAHWNIWSASYEEAHAIRQEHGGYLLAYKRHFFITDRFYIQDTLGLDPDDADWERIGRNWVKPADPEARRRLYAKVLTRTREAA